MSERELLRRTAEIAGDFLDTLDERPVFPLAQVEGLGGQLAVPLPDAPTDPLEVIALSTPASSRPPVDGTSDSSPAERYPLRSLPIG